MTLPCVERGARCYAAIRTWDNGVTPEPAGGGDGISWGDRFNWDPDQVPTGVDTARVFSGSPVVHSAFVVFSLENGVTINIPSSLVVANSAHNGGTILVTNGALAGNPSFGVSSGSLDGTGEVVLADSDFATGSARLNGAAPTSPATIHAAGHTVRGEGTIGGKWLNEGLIRAEETTGDMTAALQFGGGEITNSGVIRSSPTAAILVNGMSYTGTATGQFIADTQDILIADGTFNAGELTALNGAKYKLFSVGGPTPQVTLNGATLAAPLNFPDSGGGSLFSASGFINNSTITLDNHANPALAQVNFTGPGTIGGTGEIVLLREGNNTRISGFTEITNGASHTIRGVGAIGPQSFVNDGTVLAEPHEGDLLSIASPTRNNSLMQANNGAILFIRNPGTTQDNNTGRLRAANGGYVVIDATTVTGGKLQSEGTGAIEISAAAATFDNLTNEGTVNVRPGKFLNIAPGTFTNQGTVNVNSDDLAVNTTLDFDGNATIAGAGTIVLNRPGSGNGAILTAAGASVVTQAAGHSIRGDGRVAARLVNHGRLEGTSAATPLELDNFVYGDGVLKDVRVDLRHLPGGEGAPAIVHLEGSYTQNASSQLWIDIGGTTPGSGYDQLNSTGSITLLANVRLDVFLTSGFIPAAGNQFTIATTTGSRSGTFGTVSLPTNIANYELTWKPVAYTSTSIVLEVLSVTAMPGDYNANGIVDAADYNIWRDTFGQEVVEYSGADGDGNGIINQADYDVWTTHFGTSLGSGAGVHGVNAVPETATLVLVALGTFAQFFTRGNRRNVPE